MQRFFDGLPHRAPRRLKVKSPVEVVRAYFDAWSTKDESLLRSTLAPDVSFVGALGTA